MVIRDSNIESLGTENDTMDVDKGVRNESSTAIDHAKSIVRYPIDEPNHTVFRLIYSINTFRSKTLRHELND